jgi:hypothetical protein
VERAIGADEDVFVNDGQGIGGATLHRSRLYVREPFSSAAAVGIVPGVPMLPTPATSEVGRGVSPLITLAGLGATPAAAKHDKQSTGHDGNQ